MTKRLSLDRMTELFVAEYHRYDASGSYMGRWRYDTLALWRDMAKDQSHPYRQAYKQAGAQIEQENV